MWFVGVAGVVALAAGLGWWSARATLPVSSTGSAAPHAELTATAYEGSVGRALSLNVVVERPFTQLATNALAGVVTAVGDLDVVESGDLLYEVAGVPVRAVQGDVPFYRDMSLGAEGTDVRQLHTALLALGYATGEPSSTFGVRVESGVKAWQRDQGREGTGVVGLGELVAVPVLPTPVRIGEGIAPGLVLGGGEASVLAPVGTLEFVLSLSADQAAGITTGTRIDVPLDEHVWQATVAGSRVTEDGSTRFTLMGPDGGPVCGSECGALPNQERTSLLASVHVVPALDGTTVPVAAVRTDVQGQTYVETETGERVVVDVLGASGGVAVVDGIPTGTVVRIGTDPAGTPTSPTGTPPEDAEDGDA